MPERYVHGSTELNEHADAARELEKARQKVLNIRGNRWFIDNVEGPEVYDAQYAAAKDARLAARARLDAAYKKYTNPFGVVKTFS